MESLNRSIDSIDCAPLTQSKNHQFKKLVSQQKEFKIGERGRMHMSEKENCVCDSCRSRSVLYARIDSLIDILKPNEESERVRDGTVKWVRRHFEDAPIQSVGSYPLKTYVCVCS